MTSYLLAAVSLIAIAAVTVAGVQSSRLSSAQSDLEVVEDRLAISESRRIGAELAHRESLAVIAIERRQADAAARREASLRERIARDAGGDRDGPVAPVLDDTIRALGKIASRQDDEFVGPRKAWRLVVFIDGRLTNIIEVADQAACIGAAGAAADAIRKLPTFETELRGKVRISCGISAIGRSA